MKLDVHPRLNKWAPEMTDETHSMANNYAAYHRIFFQIVKPLDSIVYGKFR